MHGQGTWLLFSWVLNNHDMCVVTHLHLGLLLAVLWLSIRLAIQVYKVDGKTNNTNFV